MTEKIEDLVSVLFLPLYFGYAGLNVQLSDLNGAPLHSTIPRFHDLRLRLEQLAEQIENNPVGRVDEMKNEINFIEQRIYEMLKINRLQDMDCDTIYCRSLIIKLKRRI